MDSCSVLACQFSVGEKRTERIPGEVHGPSLLLFNSFVSAFYRYSVFSLAVSCHFMWFSLCLPYLSSWGPSASMKEISGCTTFISKLPNNL